MWDDVPEKFRNQIQDEHVVLVERREMGEGGEWRVDSVGDFFILVTGYAFRSSDFSDDGIPVIKIKNVKAGHFSKHQFSYVSPDFLNTRSEKSALVDDLLISMSGNRHDGSPETWVGKVALFREKDAYLINQRVGALRLNGNAKLDARFASFLLSSFPYQELFISIATSSGGQANLSPEQILGAPVRYPEIGEQRTIAHVLGTLDDKIELNRQMNQTLEEMARALFKSWFVDFDPVHAKATLKQRDAPPSQGGSDWSVERARGYLDRMDFKIAALFPDSFVDSALGPIPAGWEVGMLGDMLCQRLERCRASEETASRPYVPIDCISPKSLYLTESKTGVEAKSSLTKFYKGDLIFGAMRPYYHKVCIAPFDGTTRTTAFVLCPKQKHDFAFATLLLCDPDTIDFATRNSTGSTIPYAAWTDSLEAMPTIIPLPSVRRAFNDTIRPLLVRIPQPYFESRTLTVLRDALLPKLVSGALRV